MVAGELTQKERESIMNEYAHSMSHGFSQTILAGYEAHLTIAQNSSIPKKQIADPGHTKIGRRPFQDHFEKLKQSGRFNDVGNAIVGISVRNVQANYRCFAYIRDVTEGPVGVESDCIPSKRPFFVFGKRRDDQYTLEETDLSESSLGSYQWLFSGVPVLWDKSAHELNKNIITEASDHSHIWQIPRGDNPNAKNNSRQIWTRLQAIFKETLGEDVETAFKAINEEVEKLSLVRESNMLHNVIGLKADGSLVHVMGIGKLEHLGEKARMLGATRAICVDNSGSSIVYYSQPSENIQERIFTPLFAAPNHRPLGTAYLIIDCASKQFNISPQEILRESHRFPEEGLNREGLSEADRKMICSLCVSMDDWNRPLPYHYDKSHGCVITQNISIEHKAVREIDEAITLLSSPSTLVLPGSTEHNFTFESRARIRTITLLIGLKYYIQSIEGFADAPGQKISERPTAFNECRDIATPNAHQYKISLLLLLVHAVKYSQIAWPRDFHFELTSAGAVSKALDKFLSRVFSAKNRLPIINIVFNMIRWHTLHGQLTRETATFSFDTIIERSDGLLKGLREYFIAFSYADAFARVDESINERIISDKLRGQYDLSELLLANYAQTLIETSRLMSPAKFCKELTPVTQKKGALMICGYGRTSNIDPRNATPRWGENKPEKDQSEIIWHHSFPRSQVESGLFSTKEQLEQYNGMVDEDESLYIREFEKFHDYKKYGVNLKEYLCVTTIHPSFLAEHQYGLKNIITRPRFSNNTLAMSIDFLHRSFKAALDDEERFHGKLPFPLVKRLTDLTAAFNDILECMRMRGEVGKGERNPIFRAILEFDSGTDKFRRFDIYLPDIADDTQIAELVKNYGVDREGCDKVMEILTRYLCTFITNYGMLANWKNLDIDCTASSHSNPDTVSFWERKLNEGLRDLGLHVFQRYLENTASIIPEISHARMQYRRILDEQTMDAPLKLPEEISQYKDSLLNKYVIGIDVGGTAIKIQVFRIDKDIPDSSADSFVIANCFDLMGNRVSVWLKQHTSTGQPFSYTIPTRSSSDTLYKTVFDFSDYIFSQLYSRMRRQGQSEEQISDILKNTIVVSLTWPGPIVENHVAGVSGILKMFESSEEKPFTGRIMDDSIEKIREINLAKAVRERFIAFAKARGGVKDPKFLSVALVNDGDADALGTYVSDISKYNSLESKDMRGETGLQGVEEDKWLSSTSPKERTWFSHQAVAIVKAGTGTAGSIIQSGKVSGLNEFGKLIIDLAASNEENLRKAADSRWPVGDVNKCFSIGFVRKEATRLGADGAKLEGLDIEIVLRNSWKNGSQKPNKITCLSLGGLELCAIASPNIDYYQLENLIKDFEEGKPGSKTLRYSEVGFELVNVEDGQDYHLDIITKQKLATYTQVANLKLFLQKKYDLRTLLKKLGLQRFGELKHPHLVDRLNETCLIGKRMGQELAHLAALLHDIMNIKVLYMAGGPVRGDFVGKECFDSLNQSVSKYLSDRYFDKDTACQHLNVSKDNKPIDAKLWTSHDIVSYRGMLGAAIKGVYQFFEDQKIRDLQNLKCHSSEKRVYINKNEEERGETVFHSAPN